MTKNKRCIVYMPTGMYYQLAAKLKAATPSQSVSSFFRSAAKTKLKR
jgi:hypothetical protein